MPLLIELALSTALVRATAMFHGLSPLSFTGAAYTSAVVLGLLALAGLEIWFHALVYLAVGATSDLAGSVCFSTITFAAIGFSDAPLAAPWAAGGCHRGRQRRAPARVVGRVSGRRVAEAEASLTTQSTKPLRGIGVGAEVARLR